MGPCHSIKFLRLSSWIVRFTCTVESPQAYLLEMGMGYECHGRRADAAEVMVYDGQVQRVQTGMSPGT
jgi:hypothetical protein